MWRETRQGRRADAACAKASKERSARVVGGRHEERVLREQGRKKNGRKKETEREREEERERVSER